MTLRATENKRHGAYYGKLCWEDRNIQIECPKNKLIIITEENANVSIDVDGETIDKVNSLTYIGAIKTNTGSCLEYIKAILGKAKSSTMKPDTIWVDRGIGTKRDNYVQCLGLHTGRRLDVNGR